MERNHYILLVDDSGARSPNHKIQEGKEIDCFALGGVLIHERDIAHVLQRHKEFCDAWDISCPLHSYEIRNATDKFSWIGKDREVREKFFISLGDFLTTLPVIGFAAVVDRPGYNQRYGEYKNDRWSMCKTAFAVLIERVAKYVLSKDATFEILFEGSNRKENELLVSYGRSYKIEGLPFDGSNSGKYTPLQAHDFKRLLLGKPERGFKSNPLLQIADLYLFPLIMRKYHGVDYIPWKSIFENKRVIDALLPEDQWSMLGIKYSCFESK